MLRRWQPYVKPGKLLMPMLNITLLGSTGSIGQNTLDVISRNLDCYRVFALTAHDNVELLWQQCQQFRPRYAVMVQQHAAQQLQQRLQEINSTTEVLSGQQALEKVASHSQTDCVLAAIVGGVGLLPTLAAAKAGKRILLANKEALVMAGSLFMDTVRQNKAVLLPIDSEHNAIFQCLSNNFPADKSSQGIRRIVLTASGGPFRDTPMEQLAKVTPEQACAHPNWIMGKKVSIDSATMMNKALEVIEAHWIFNIAPEAISVLLHPQSVLHSMVEYLDGSVVAQLGIPDMRIPIAHALAWPKRISSGAEQLDLTTLSRLDFYPLSLERFPALSLAYRALGLGGTASIALNAANEITVAAFLEGRISFTQIVKINEAVLNQFSLQPANTLESILNADRQARQLTQEQIQKQLNYIP